MSDPLKLVQPWFLHWQMWPFSPVYEQVSRRKQAARAEALAAVRGEAFADATEQYIRATASEIVQRISQGEWTASQVLEAYLARAVLAQGLTNCLTEVFFSQARAEATALDEEFTLTGKIRGPLHGVPVSFKDIFDVKGYDTTMGYSSYADKPASEDAHDSCVNVRYLFPQTRLESHQYDRDTGSVEDLELAARLVFGIQGAEFDPAPLSYRDVRLPAKLRLGYYLSDGYVKASPACQRAVLKAVEALRKAGHECVEFEFPQAAEAMEIYMSITTADGLRTMQEPLNGDPMEPGISTTILSASLPKIARMIIAWVAKCILGDIVFVRTTRGTGYTTVQEYHKSVVRRNAYARMFEKQVWEKHNLDGIIAPVIALPAVPHGACKYVSPIAAGVCHYNVLNLPVGVVPVTRVRTTDIATAEWTNPKVGPGHGSPLLERLLYGTLDRAVGHGTGGLYNAEKMAGMPVGVQVVGRRWEDEKVIEMMKVLDHALGPRGFGPLNWVEQKE
ncbi:amidase signature enzyme [Dichomitus squalens LYAD-421 SS1]|uniref:amidase signature enzyme n=1 Tax=Dichomitus squalens (strain LYAD-421) TaxID=732165 RepID=UPI0004413A34|nr:amidase signature enzyme [Dichomitus squalens LYAD-421 SS1]EJF64237.1 amidase signature enzyme [Dichomitus squalens LYAD-421 SS1]